jgi:hypothetical protein
MCHIKFVATTVVTVNTYISTTTTTSTQPPPGYDWFDEAHNKYLFWSVMGFAAAMTGKITLPILQILTYIIICHWLQCRVIANFYVSYNNNTIYMSCNRNKMYMSCMEPYIISVIKLSVN